MKNNYSIHVNMNSINEKRALITEKYNDLAEMFKTYQKMINDIEKVYDTPSSRQFVKIASRYMDVSFFYLKNSLNKTISQFENISKTYQEFNDETSNMVNLGDKYEV